jgi:hypothetical protein
LARNFIAQKPGCRPVQRLYPAQAGVVPPPNAKSSSFTITLDEKGGVSISPNTEKAKKADDKRKCRGARRYFGTPDIGRLARGSRRC